MHSHTACQLGPARIAYHFHPFFDRRVVVLRVMRRSESPSVIVRVEQHDGENDEELRINVPCWMLDEQACSRLIVDVKSEVNCGRVAIDGLLRLRMLVDSGLMVIKGDCHDSTTTTSEDVASEAADA